MVVPGDRRLSSKFKKTSSGTKKEYFKSQNTKKRCAITGKRLSGVPQGTKSAVAKHSKTEKRPSVPFGGILSGEARENVFIELGKVVAGVKSIDDVEIKYKKYVEQAMKRAEK